MNRMFLSWLQTHVENENGGIYWKWWPQIHRGNPKKDKKNKTHKDHKMNCKHHCETGLLAFQSLWEFNKSCKKWNKLRIVERIDLMRLEQISLRAREYCRVWSLGLCTLNIIAHCGTLHIAYHKWHKLYIEYCTMHVTNCTFSNPDMIFVTSSACAKFTALG